LSEESNHLSDELKPKLEDAQNGDTSTWKVSVAGVVMPTAPFHGFMNPLFAFQCTWESVYLFCEAALALHVVKSTEAGWPEMWNLTLWGQQLNEMFVSVQSRMELLWISMFITMYLARRTSLCKISVFTIFRCVRWTVVATQFCWMSDFIVIFFLLDGPVAVVVKCLCQWYSHFCVLMSSSALNWFKSVMVLHWLQLTIRLFIVQTKFTIMLKHDTFPLSVAVCLLFITMYLARRTSLCKINVFTIFLCVRWTVVAT
jgi:hypothetical protein